jgi:hypothetical protein
MTPDLPVAAGRYRPASPEAVSRYARNLAWLLERPLQACEEDLAALYGYGSAHELRLELLEPGQAGPYDDPPERPDFCITDGERAPRGTALTPPTARERRLFALLERQLDGRGVGLRPGFTRRLWGCFDAGFFSSPKQHCQAFEKVKAGVLAEETGGEKREAWLQRHWPVGYWAMLQWLYCAQERADEPDPAGSPPAHGGVTRRAAAAWRAPWIYRILTAPDPTTPEADRRLPEWHRSTHGEEPRLEIGVEGLFQDNVERQRACVEELLRICPRGAPCSVPTEEDWKALLALFAGRDGGEVLRAFDGIPRLAQYARQWRLHQLRQMCRQWEQNEAPILLLQAQSEWPINKALRRRLRAKLDAPDGRVALSLQLRSKRKPFGLEGHMSLWRYSARFVRLPPAGEVGTLIGRMNGTLVVPFDDEGVVDPRRFLEILAEASEQLDKVRRVLHERYFHLRGMTDVRAFVGQECNGKSIATADVDVEPEWRGKGLVPTMFKLICTALDDYPCSAMGSSWEVTARRLKGERLGENEAVEIESRNTGVGPLSTVGAFLVAIQGEPPMRLPVDPQVQGSRLFDRGNSTPAEMAKRKLMRHFTAMQAEVGCDIVTYDPYEYLPT